MRGVHGVASAMSDAASKKAITLAVILARAGSKGLANKNLLNVGGRPMLAWTVEHARESREVDAVVLSTDSDALVRLAESLGVEVIARPAELAHDTATVDAAARHAVEQYEARHGVRAAVVVILYGNVPVRPVDLTDRAVAKLRETGADSVQSVYSVEKMHPYWMKRLGGDSGDVLEMYEPNAVYRRQDLPPVYMLDGGVIVARRESLFVVEAGQPHAFLGRDRRAVVTQPGEVVDIDSPVDLQVAEAVLRGRQPAATQVE